MSNPYQVLGLAPGASQKAIKEAYRRLAKQYHPDADPTAGPAAAEARLARFHKIKSAYEALSGASARSPGGKAHQNAGRPRKGRGGSKPRQAARAKGQRHAPPKGARAKPKPAPAASNEPAARKERAARSEPAEGLGPYRATSKTSLAGAGPRTPPGAQKPAGSGALNALKSAFKHMRDGFETGANGPPTDDLVTPFMSASKAADSRVCVVKISLEECFAGAEKKVRLPDGQVVSVTVRPGADPATLYAANGTALDANEAGESGLGFRIETLPHPLFERRGSDVHLTLPVSVPEAVLGARIPVPTLAGTVMLTVPKGADPARPLRLQGRGLAKPKGGAGDQRVTLAIQTGTPAPSHVESALEAWQAADQASGRSVRPSDWPRVTPG